MSAHGVTNTLAEEMRVAVVQTTTDANVTWASGFAMSPDEADIAWHEITRAFQLLCDDEHAPDLVLCPELALPTAHVRDMKDLATSLGSIVVTGVDYTVDDANQTIGNHGLVIVPKGWPDRRTSAHPDIFRFGKTYAAPKEEERITRGSYTFLPDPTVWLFHASRFGRIGMCICYDFMDLERALMYRARVHHFLVIAYNQDLQSFQGQAESFSRSVFSNVVICNTGHFGGSVAVSPFYRPHMRTIYRHEGAKLFTVQTFTLPVRELDLAQMPQTDAERPQHRDGGPLFKNRPPGFSSSDNLKMHKQSLA